MSNRIWIIATALISVVIVALGYFLGVAPKLAEAAKADSDRAAVENQNGIYEAELAALIKQYDGIDEIRAELAQLQLALPPDAGQPALLDEIDAFAAASGVTVTEITQDVPVAYGDFGSGNTLIGVPLSVKASSGDFVSLMGFMRQLQTGTRLIMVSNFTLSVDGAWTLEFRGYAYTLATAATTPVTPAPEVAAPEAPAPEETPAPESTEAPAPTPTETTTP